MGKLEEEARNERRKGYLRDAVLMTVAVGGVVAVGLLAPGVIQLLGGFGSRKKRFAEQARTAAGRLAAKGYVEFVEKDRKKFLRITDKGEEAMEEIKQRLELGYKLKKPRKWDRRWRIVVFDIPERRRGVRRRLRDMLISFGFVRMQDSVWVFPFDCEELITLLKSELRIGKDVLYAIAEKIENDRWLRVHFKLPLPDFLQ